MAFDPTMLSVITTSLAAARHIAVTAKDIRDFNQFAATISQINDQFLNSQDGLLQLQAAMFALQQEHFETAEKLRKMEEAALERDRYSLFEINTGNFAYRVNVTPDGGGSGEPEGAKPMHYLCQPCFDGSPGRKSVLRLDPHDGNIIGGWECVVCQTFIRDLDGFKAA